MQECRLRCRHQGGKGQRKNAEDCRPFSKKPAPTNGDTMMDQSSASRTLKGTLCSVAPRHRPGAGHTRQERVRLSDAGEAVRVPPGWTLRADRGDARRTPEAEHGRAPGVRRGAAREAQPAGSGPRPPPRPRPRPPIHARTGRPHHFAGKGERKVTPPPPGCGETWGRGPISKGQL